MKILEIKDSMITIPSEKGYFINQPVQFDKKILGLIIKTTDTKTYVLVDESAKISFNSEYKVLSDPWSVTANNDEFGRVIDVYGKTLFADAKLEKVKKPEHKYKTKEVETKAPMFSDRLELDEPLETGLFAVDTLIPIGLGQRELIIGDRKTGKTSIALSTIINQKNKNIKVIYVSIGQKQNSLNAVYQILNDHGALVYTTIIAAQPELKLSQYIAPYIAMAKAESFASNDEDVLVIFDDLTKHANIYREMSLVLERSGGREAYPADLFYLHSKLIERGGKFAKEIGGGSITVLPIIETVESDFATLLATNVISITDGQIITDTSLAKQNVFPAINIGLSVSRTGSAVQSKSTKQVAKALSKIYTQYVDAKKYEMISLDVSKEVKERITRGLALVRTFEQKGYRGMDATRMFLLGKLVESSVVLTQNRNINDLFDEQKDDQTLSKIVGMMTSNFDLAASYLDVYFKMTQGLPNKYNAKRVEVKNE